MNTTDLTSDISFEPATGLVGAWVHGVALDEQDAAVAATLQRRLHEHGVLFFQFGEVLSSEAFVTFAQLFGEVEDGYRLTLKDKTESPFIDSDLAPMKDVRINVFHTDGTALEHPPQAAILTPVELPPAGGDTMFASMAAAWDALSPHYQRMLEGLEVLHSTRRLPFLRDNPEYVHPAVIRDAVTGRKLLFVNANYSDRVLGMSERESEELLQFLFAHINTPEFHVRLRWRPGTVAVWEERVVQHRGVADFTGPRKLRRLTYKGTRPSL
ncbi:MAG: TauD/TfdA family dioxygenase [Sphingomonadales bacterium]|nr:TauD/TfdA family dioxygenase [Sphingomonadales bacterium]